MGNSFLLIVAGLLLFYVVVSDKWKCVEGFAGCVTGLGGASATPTSAPVSFPTLPTLPAIPSGAPMSNLAAQYIYGV